MLNKLAYKLQLNEITQNSDLNNPINNQMQINNQRNLYDYNINQFLSHLDYAFQPIVNVHNGLCFGVEALLRNHDNLGYGSITQFFEHLYQNQLLYKIDLILREKVLEKFCQIKFHKKIKLFYNLDVRISEMPDYKMGNTLKLLDKFNLDTSNICYELPENRDFEQNNTNIIKLLNLCKQQGYQIAIDDFGAGFANLKLFYHSEPESIKIDRFFIKDIPFDSKKKLFVSNIINLAHVLGILVIAEGVETELEFYVCKELGCDLVQGYYVQRPTTNYEDIQMVYSHTTKSNDKDNREQSSDQKLIYDQIESIEPIVSNADMIYVFDCFKKHKSYTFFPVVNQDDQPEGLIKDTNLKKYAYSAYGKDLIKRKTIKDFITSNPIADINTKAEKILEIFSLSENDDGITITKDGKYIGFLSAKSLLKVLNEKNLTIARDQNPLTKLPGNSVINEFIVDSLQNRNSSFIFAYFDFDNFKPFNDKYGFRQGDRAIQLFADILKSNIESNNHLLGHIGGDDYFIGFKDLDFSTMLDKIKNIIDKFKNDVTSFYNEEDRERKYIISKDRDGNIKHFPLLTVSASILYIPKNREADVQIEEIIPIFSHLKKSSKRSITHITLATLLPY